MAGKMDQVKGRTKKAIGELTGSRRMKNEGLVDKASGKVKSGVEKVRRILHGKRY